MNLATYLERKGLHPADFAKTIRVHRFSVDRYARGLRIPTPEVMRRIHRATAGKVTPTDFVLRG